MATPTLLGLHRELRNIICGYLHQEIETDWPWPKGSSSVYSAKITFKNAPLPSLLLVHSQLHAEYVEADCLWQFCTILDLSSIEGDDDADYDYDNED
jgi:hypothetical protein